MTQRRRPLRVPVKVGRKVYDVIGRECRIVKVDQRGHDAPDRIRVRFADDGRLVWLSSWLYEPPMSEREILAITKSSGLEMKTVRAAAVGKGRKEVERLARIEKIRRAKARKALAAQTRADRAAIKKAEQARKREARRAPERLPVCGEQVRCRDTRETAEVIRACSERVLVRTHRGGRRWLKYDQLATEGAAA